MVDYYSLRCYHHEIGKKAHEPKRSVLLVMFFISPDNVIIFVAPRMKYERLVVSARRS